MLDHYEDFYRRPDLSGKLGQIRKSHSAPIVVLLKSDGPCAALSCLLKNFAEKDCQAAFLEGETSSPYSFIIPFRPFFYSIFCAKGRYSDYSAIDPNKIEKISLIMGITRVMKKPETSIFDIIKSFYGFKHDWNELLSKFKIYQEIQTVLSHLAFASDIVFHIKDADKLDEDTAELIRYLCKNVKTGKIMFVLSHPSSKDIPAKIKKIIRDNVFGEFSAGAIAAEDIIECVAGQKDAMAKLASSVARASCGSPELAVAAFEALCAGGIISRPAPKDKYLVPADFSVEKSMASIGGSPRELIESIIKNLGANEREVFAASSIFYDNFRTAEISASTGLSLEDSESALSTLIRRGLIYETSYPGIFAHPTHEIKTAAFLSSGDTESARGQYALVRHRRLIAVHQNLPLPDIGLGRLIHHALAALDYDLIISLGVRLTVSLCEINSVQKALTLVNYIEHIIFGRSKEPVALLTRLPVYLLHSKIFMLLGRFAKAFSFLSSLRRKAESAGENEKKAAGRFITEIDKLLGFIMLLKPSLVPEGDSPEKRFVEALSRGSGDLKNRVESSNLIALHYYQSGDLEKSGIFFRDNIKILSMHRNDPTLWIELDSAERGLSSIYLRQGEFRKALAYLKKCEEGCLRFDSRRTLANTYQYMGMIHHNRGEFPKAIEYYERAISVLEGLSDRIAISRIWTSLGVTCHNLGKYKDALSYFNRSLEIAVQTNNRKAIAILNGNTAKILAILNDLEGARSALKEDIAILEEIEDRFGMAFALAYMGSVHHMAGRTDEAMDCFKKSFEISRKSTYLTPLIISALGIIQCTPPVKMPTDGKKIIEELIVVDGRELDVVSRSLILRTRGIFEAMCGIYHRASCFVNQALINYEKIGMPLENALCLMDESRLLKLNGLSDESTEKINTAIGILKSIDARYYIEKFVVKKSFF